MKKLWMIIEMIDPTLEFLYGLHNRGIKLGLKNINSFLKVCGNPHKKIKTIHLAGTNGKGSTSSIIAKILQKNGYKVGLYTSPHLINFNEISNHTDKIIKKFNVNAPSNSSKASQLSGGNLQKFIIGREILSNPELLILSQPTWGIDAGSESFIRKTLIDLSLNGISIIIISHDIDELLEISHDVCVLYEGRLSKKLNVEQINTTQLGKYMGGLFD